MSFIYKYKTSHGFIKGVSIEWFVLINKWCYPQSVFTHNRGPNFEEKEVNLRACNLLIECLNTQYTNQFLYLKNVFLRSPVCGAVGRAVASNTSDLRFEFSHRQYYLLSTVLKRRKLRKIFSCSIVHLLKLLLNCINASLLGFKYTVLNRIQKYFCLLCMQRIGS